MIATAIVQLLRSSSEIMTLTGGRITLSVIPQDQPVPCIYLGTDNVRPIACRDPRGAFSGALEVGFQTKTYADLEALTKAVRTTVDNYSGTVAGTTLNINRAESTTDDFDDTLKYHTRALLFQVSGSQLNQQ